VAGGGADCVPALLDNRAICAGTDYQGGAGGLRGDHRSGFDFYHFTVCERSLNEMSTTYTDVTFTNQREGGITARKLNKLRDDLSTAISAGGGGTPASGVFIWGEIPTGAINGTNKNFTTINTYAAGQLAVYLNGVRQRRPDDYSETSSSAFQLVSAPLSGDLLSIDYMKL
jgi:hypothetical protein